MDIVVGVFVEVVVGVVVVLVVGVVTGGIGHSNWVAVVVMHSIKIRLDLVIGLNKFEVQVISEVPIKYHY